MVDSAEHEAREEEGEEEEGVWVEEVGEPEDAFGCEGWVDGRGFYAFEGLEEGGWGFVRRCYGVVGGGGEALGEKTK